MLSDSFAFFGLQTATGYIDNNLLLTSVPFFSEVYDFYGDFCLNTICIFLNGVKM